ncbi:cytochrome c peroxidase [Pedobacter sp. P351]|uniref:cytochrome-c peroxidase n=1 Tax=Pedobacter superstes TaxID=3133441 RepID=UPI0030A7E348
MRTKIFILSVVLGFVLLSFRFSHHKKSAIGVDATLGFYTKEASLFVNALENLNTAIQQIDADSASILKARQALITCRLKYKRIEFFTSYFFPSETRFYNAAPKFEVEEPTLELVEPMGLQQIETLLFEPNVLANKAALLAHSEVLISSAKVLPTLLYGFEANDMQILESIRLQLIRMSVLSISGYDAPLLRSGIVEVAESTEALKEVLKPYLASSSEESKRVNGLLTGSLKYLKAHPDFDSFNRMEYLTRFALPLQKHFAAFVKEQNLELNTTAFLNYNSDHIYSPNAIKSFINNGSDSSAHIALVTLGEKLFFDKSLSGNLAVSCASCHQPDKYFADLLPRSPSLIPDSTLKRNTPTLLYAGRQHAQFWEGSAKDLASQIHTVIMNPLEMKGSPENLYRNIFSKKTYQQLGSASFPDKKPESMGMTEVTSAIAAFVNELNPMNSAFDKYISGDVNAMDTNQIKGFNLFMGKAQCGTCHFPPYFNSLLPPLYDLSEVEVLGTAETENFKLAVLDNDLGRYNVFRIRYYDRAFKTPTVRNAARTAPYMHNGSISSLNKVVEFYNLGGGKGLGLDVPEQTLSATQLNLSEREIKDLISFIESLTDSPNKTYKQQN